MAEAAAVATAAAVEAVTGHAVAGDTAVSHGCGCSSGRVKSVLEPTCNNIVFLKFSAHQCLVVALSVCNRLLGVASVAQGVDQLTHVPILITNMLQQPGWVGV